MLEEVLIKIWDVQHGHAAYIKTPTGKHIVIDLGTGSYEKGDEFSPLLHLKNNYGVDKVDYCIITHPHMDHIDDILNWEEVKPKVLERAKKVDIGKLLEDSLDKDQEKLEKYKEINNHYTRPVCSDEEISPNNEVSFGSKIKLFRSEKEQSNLNNYSSVFLIEFEGFKAVIPGDNENASWEELLEDEEFKRKIKDADIYLASHHGRESGYHSEIMDLINPKLTIISDSKYHETSCREKYTNVSSGWEVEKKDGTKEQRKTLSTYNDGVITIKFQKFVSTRAMNVKIGK